MPARAASAHSAGEGSRRCGIRTGAIRINAPLPAEGCPARYQGSCKFLYANTNWLTVSPIPKIFSSHPGNLLRRSLRQQLAAGVASLRTQVDYPVRSPDQFQVVL